MIDKKKDILHIIGAGPAGLAVAYYAKKKNLEPIIYESSENVGGNCRTIIHGDFKFDLGAHAGTKRFKVCEEIRPQGSIIIFPSFTYHCVTPCTRGTRYSLVLWSLGRPWQ